MGQSRSQTLPIIPLPKGVVLLPGVTLRIPVAGRSDILALLTSIYSRSKATRPDAAAVPIGCVPLRSPLLSPDGKQLIESKSPNGKDHDEDASARLEYENSNDLFGYGTVARISGVQGRRPDDLTLVVEGLRRFKIIDVTQERPFLEAAVTIFENEGIVVLISSRKI